MLTLNLSFSQLSTRILKPFEDTWDLMTFHLHYLVHLNRTKTLYLKPLLIKVYIRYFKRSCFAISNGFHSSKNVNVC